VRDLIDIVTVLDVTAADVREAFELDLDDYEDAVQVRCALSNTVDAIITRDEGLLSYKDPRLRMLRPNEALSSPRSAILDGCSEN
jgi:predicted nucleic acid-binding protein